MKATLLLICATLLTGCAGFTNVVYCDGESAVFVSWYRGIGIAAQVEPENGKRRCAS